MRYVIKETIKDSAAYHAGSKARKDFESVFIDNSGKVVDIEFSKKESVKKHYFSKIIMQFKNRKIWNSCFKKFKAGDNVYIQYPPTGNTVFLGALIKKYRKRGITFIAMVHDADSIRVYKSKFRSIPNQLLTKTSEKNAFKRFNYIIVHNHKMRDYFVTYFKRNEEELVNLEIFDYLISDDLGFLSVNERFLKPIDIAGNLAKTKAGYVYNLPTKPLFDLFGPNYSDETKKNVNYRGKYLPDDLPKQLNGMFGLVWDGPTSSTCSDSFGLYLRYNNPHKTSLYLASGIPVIIWSKAALAEFILDNNVGITIDSLDEINEKILNLSFSDYSKMLDNVRIISKKIRNGFYFLNSINSVESKVNYEKKH